MFFFCPFFFVLLINFCITHQKVFERIGVRGKGNFSQKVSLSPQKIKLYFCFFLNCEGDIPVCAFTHFERYLASANDSMSAISFKV